MNTPRWSLFVGTALLLLAAARVADAECMSLASPQEPLLFQRDDDSRLFMPVSSCTSAASSVFNLLGSKLAFDVELATCKSATVLATPLGGEAFQMFKADQDVVEIIGGLRFGYAAGFDASKEMSIQMAFSLHSHNMSQIEVHATVWQGVHATSLQGAVDLKTLFVGVTLAVDKCEQAAVMLTHFEEQPRHSSAVQARACRTTATAGQVQMTINSATKSVAVLQDGGTNQAVSVTTSGTAITAGHGTRFYLGNVGECPSTWSGPTIMKSWPLLGASLGYTIDLSAVGCGCNSAIYFIKAPAYNKNNQLVPGSTKSYYCDANQVGGYFCPEIDLMEANTNSFAFTPHKCNTPSGKYYPYCDKWGCGNKVDAQTSAYGPSSSKKINTAKKFNVKFQFVEQSSTLYNIIVTLTQGSNSVTMSYTDSSRSCYQSDSTTLTIRKYLAAMKSETVAGMVMALSNWGDSGSSMAWLDSPPCSSSVSCNKGAFIVRDIWYTCPSGASCAKSSAKVSSAPLPCSLSLPSDASDWGTCSGNVSSGSSCSFSCSSGKTAVSGYCVAGTWRTSPSCKGCTTNKTCGTQKCGSIWDGCSTTSCGTCDSSSYCDGETCKSLDSLSEWSQVLPDSYTSNNWAVSSGTLSLTNFSLPSLQRVIKFTGSQSTWFSEGYTTVSALVSATEGTVGVGLRIGQGSGRELDRLTWKFKISGSTASSSFCYVYKGTEKCKNTESGLYWSTTEANNITVSLVFGASYINNFANVNERTVWSNALTVQSDRYNSSGSLFVTALGSASKTFANITVRSLTSVHVVLTECMTTSQWNSFVVNLLGISDSSISTRGIGSDASCNSSRKRDAELGDEATFTEFEMLLEDDIASSTPSSSLSGILTEAVNGGAATWSDVGVSALTATLPEAAAGTFVAESSSLSAAAIGGIAAGAAGAVICVAVGGTAYAAKRSRNQNREPESNSKGRKSFLHRMFEHDAVDVMNNPTAPHTSITARAAPVAVEIPEVTTQ